MSFKVRGDGAIAQHPTVLVLDVRTPLEVRQEATRAYAEDIGEGVSSKRLRRMWARVSGTKRRAD